MHASSLFLKHFAEWRVFLKCTLSPSSGGGKMYNSPSFFEMLFCKNNRKQKKERKYLIAQLSIMQLFLEWQL